MSPLPALRLYLFDDAEARGWAPLSRTRPVGEILFGALLQRERLERATGLTAEGYLQVAGLQGFEENGAPPVVPSATVARDRALLLLSSRYVPPFSAGDIEGTLGLPSEVPGEGARLTVGQTPVGWLLPPGADPSVAIGREAEAGGGAGGASATVVEVGGEVLETPWDLVERNAARTTADLEALYGHGSSDSAHVTGLQGVERIGTGIVSAAADVAIDPGVVLDTRSGPIRLEAGVRIRPFTYLRGPALIGEASTLLGGTFESLSAGPLCKLRGEISECVLLGYSNKAHDGYLGHSLVGRWVNLGAFTTNSDLKNNYGTIRMLIEGSEIDTEKLKVGVFLGDHVKTGIGTQLNAGTCIGAGSNVFGSGYPPKWVPPFSWCDGPKVIPYRLEAFLETAERAMGRRDVKLTEAQRSFFARLWRTAHELEGHGAS